VDSCEAQPYYSQKSPAETVYLATLDFVRSPEKKVCDDRPILEFRDHLVLFPRYNPSNKNPLWEVSYWFLFDAMRHSREHRLPLDLMKVPLPLNFLRP